jgi:phasin
LFPDTGSRATDEKSASMPSKDDVKKPVATPAAAAKSSRSGATGGQVRAMTPASVAAPALKVAPPGQAATAAKSGAVTKSASVAPPPSKTASPAKAAALQPAPAKIAPPQAAAKPISTRPIAAAGPVDPALPAPVAAAVAKPAPAARLDISKPRLRPVESAKSEDVKSEDVKSEDVKSEPAKSEAMVKPALSVPTPRSVDAVSVPAALAPAFIPASAAVAEPLRQLADTGLTQAREAYTALKGSTERLTGGMDRSSQAATEGMQAFGVTLLEAMQANADAAFGFIKAMTSVKSLSEAVELQTRHARTQFEAMTTQAKELTGIVNRTASAASEPVRKALDASFRKAS